MRKSILGIPSTILCLHDGLFHADDVLCYVLVKYFIDKNVILKRISRDKVEEEKRTCDLMLDVGNEDKVSDTQVFFDHHSSPTTYPNGIKLAACGKFLRYIYQRANQDDDFVYNYLLEQLMYGVEAEDNGQRASDFGYTNILSFIRPLNLSYSETVDYDKEQYQAFLQAARITEQIFQRILDKARRAKNDDIALSRILAAAIQSQQQFVTLPSFYETAIPKIVTANTKLDKPMLYLVYNDLLNDQWVIRCVPVAVNSFDLLKPLPSSWAGLRNDALAKESGVSDAVFCHLNRFMAVTKTYEGIMKMLEIAINS